MDLPQGETLAGYLIEGVLGRGGMGTVYRARHPRLPRSVALKLLNADVADDPELRARFEREAHVVATLDHPGIVAIQDRGVQDGRPWLAMQYVEGTDASKLDARSMRPDRAVRIIGEIAAALDYAHSRGVLHRDVKPANILLTTEQAGRTERAVLTDFGIARLLTSDTQLTSTGTFTATLAYASPEQLSGHAIDHRSDQYSLACTLFALLSGRAPFAATDPGQVVAAHLSRPVPPLGRPDVPPHLDAVIARAMAKNPAERFASAGEFAAAAAHAISGQPVAPVPPRPAFQGGGWANAPETAVFGHTPSPPPPAGGALSDWPAACAVAFGFLVLLLAHSAVGAGSPRLLHELGIELADFHWLNTVYLLFAVTPMVAAGRLGDRFGPRTVHLAGLTLGVLGSAAASFAPGFLSILAAQAVLGLGIGLSLPQIIAIIVRTFAPDRRGAAFGLWGGAGAAVPLFFPLMDQISWRWATLAVVPLGLVAVAAAATLVPTLPRPSAPDRGLDIGLAVAGAFLLAVGLGHALAGDWVTRGLPLVAGTALCALFLALRARRTDDPALPARVLRQRNWWLSHIAVLIMGTSNAALLTMLSVAMIQVSTLGIGVALAPAALITLLLAPIMGAIADRIRPGVIPVAGFALSMAAGVGIVALSHLEAENRLVAVIGGLIAAVLGVGSACLWGPLAATATHDLPPERAGIGAGVYATVLQIGTLAGATVLLDLLKMFGLLRDWKTDLPTVVIVVAIMQVTGAVAAALLARRDTGGRATPAPHEGRQFHVTTERW